MGGQLSSKTSSLANQNDAGYTPHSCAGCGKSIGLGPQKKTLRFEQVYQSGRWVAVEIYHTDCAPG